MGSGYTCISCLRCVVCCIDDVEAFQSNCRKNNFHTWLQMSGHFTSVYYTTPSAQCAIFWGRQYHLDYRCESALVFSKLAPRISLFSINNIFCLIFLSHPVTFHIPLSCFSEIHIQYHHNIQNRAGKIVDLIFLDDWAISGENCSMQTSKRVLSPLLHFPSTYQLSIFQLSQKRVNLNFYLGPISLSAWCKISEMQET